MKKKMCTKCKQEKTIDNFRKYNKYKDGFRNWCNNCHNEYNKIWMKKYNKRLEVKKRNNIYKKKYQRERMKNIKHHLDSVMACAIGKCLRGEKKGRTWRSLVGYNITDLLKYIESLFDKNMCWDNYGNYWEIDHIKPKSLFKYTKPEDKEFKECWALSNLQPLEKSINRKKYNTWK